ncbi:hypothetical protein J567_4192, partial [Acinetobacter baumannii 754286]
MTQNLHHIVIVGGGAGGKVAVFGILKRGGMVYVKV